MTKKDTYLTPETGVFELLYREAVCQAASQTDSVPDYDVVDGSGLSWDIMI